ncbi:hypothetical protein, partial [Rhabdochromatium marinum]|uniref:hypothetical protein n=1 Tax=Rhabdochromatium marinum TaxID=48729 RepID=UPI001A90DB03
SLKQSAYHDRGRRAFSKPVENIIKHRLSTPTLEIISILYNELHHLKRAGVVDFHGAKMRGIDFAEASYQSKK